METSQLICRANQLIGFYMVGALVLYIFIFHGKMFLLYKIKLVSILFNFCLSSNPLIVTYVQTEWGTFVHNLFRML